MNKNRITIIASFLSVTVGFLAGYWLASQESSATPVPDGGAPHAVGAQEYIQLGVTALQTGQFTSAEQSFRTATELLPGDPTARANLAVSLMYQERWEEADRELTLAREHGPDLPDVYFLEGVVARDGFDDIERARTAWNRFLELIPEDAPQVEQVRQWLSELEEEPAED